MSASQKTKNKKISNSNSKKNKKTIRVKHIVVLAIIAGFIILTINPKLPRRTNKEDASRVEIDFKKEGVLTFYKAEGEKEILTIDIEIAEDDYDRTLGLMYRYSMSDSVGMLFIMELEKPQSFWMRNTYVSLDIIYANKDLEIVSIHKRTKILNDDPIPSIRNAKYVIEVVGGFSDIHNIMEGDYFNFEHTTIQQQ